MVFVFIAMAPVQTDAAQSVICTIVQFTEFTDLKIYKVLHFVLSGYWNISDIKIELNITM
jgi:hypothetical protein